MASIDRSFESSFPHGRFGAAKSRPPALEPTLPTDAPRDRLRDLTALALLAGVLFLVASLATYHPADPPGARAFPPHARAVNACGFIGSATAGLLYEWLGLGAWFVTALLVGLDVALLRRRDLADLPLKTVGAVLATGGVCTLLAMFLPIPAVCFSPVLPIGPAFLDLAPAVFAILLEVLARAFALFFALVPGGVPVVHSLLPLVIAISRAFLPTRTLLGAGDAFALRGRGSLRR